MIRRKLNVKTIGALLITIMTVCLSAFAANRSSDAWTLNPSDFRYDMVLYFSISAQGYDNLDEYEIGAFIDDECRGLAENVKLPEGGTGLYMRIRSNSTAAQEISFLMRNKQTGKLYHLTPKGDEPIVFKSNEMVGMPSDPCVLYIYFDVKVAASDNGSVDFSDGLYPGGTEIRIVAVPDEGYHFDSWSDGNKEADRTLTVTGDLDLTASFAPNSYTVEFKVGDELIATKTFLYGENIVAPEAPVKEGYTFTGWVDLPATMPAKDIVIVGDYAVTTYKIVFMAGDQEIESKDLAFGASIVAPEAPAKEGYTFTGWSELPSTMPAGDLVITANYTVNHYKLTFSIGDEVVESKEIAYGAAIAAPSVEEKTGYTFSGWGDVPATMPARDLEFKGTYSINSYKLTFVVDDVVIEESEVAYGSAISAPSMPEKDGQKFAGWLNLAETMPAEDLTIYGSYEKNSRLLTFMIDDQIFEERVLLYGAEITVPEVPAKEGYTFSGWGNVPSTMPDQDLVITGSYTANSYKLTFILGDETLETKDMAYGSDITAPAAPEKEGYTFSGWGEVPATMPAKDLVITGSYTLNSYQLTFMIDGEQVESKQVFYGAVIVAPDPEEKPGYTFSGWGDVPATMPAKDLVLTAGYKVNSYKLTFIIDDTVVEEKEVAFGADIVTPATPDKEGKKFAGWLNLVYTMPASDLTIYGSYENNSYLLTFMVDDEVIEEKVMTFEAEITAPAAPEKEGYTFDGWGAVPATMPDHDLVIKGSYTLNIYKVNFILDDGLLETKEVAFGFEITAPEAPEKTGYTFTGWIDMPAAMPAKDIEIKGSYSVNSYLLTFVIDDVVVEEKEVAFGAAIEAPATPDKEGNTFKGWLNMAETMPAENLTIYGSYEKNSQLLTFMIDGQVIEEKVLQFGSEIVAPEAPVKEGYTFSGWVDVPATMPARDLVISGSYTVNSYKLTFAIGDDTIETKEMEYGSEIAAPEAPEKEGYTFLGWTEVPATMPAKDTVITGSYAINSYKLTFVIDDTVVEEKEVAYGSEIAAPATPDKDGHKFVGWFNYVPTMPASDLTILGTYEKNTHLLTFMIDGEIIEEKVVAYGSEIAAPEAPVKEGYTFKGWGKMPATMPAADLTINGSYTINRYKITFLINNEVVEAKEMPYGAEITAPEAPEMEGYTFIGWGDVPATMPAENIEFTGRYAANTYKLTFVIDDTVVEVKDMIYGAEIAAPATPDKEGHTFQGWLNYVPTMPAADLTIYGSYLKNASLLTFVIDGQVIEEKVMEYGAEITAPEAPEKEGYTFEGWVGLPATMPAKDLVIDGSYKVNYYKLTVVIDDTVVEEKEVAYGADIVTPATPDKEGHTFQGWLNYVPTMPANDLTLYGSYLKNACLLTFVIDDEVIEERVMEYGDVIIAPEAPEKEGYTFEGWDNLPSTMPAQDLVINGDYTVNYYTLTFVIDDAVVEEKEIAYGADIVTPDTPDKEGHRFEGWFNYVPTMPASDLTIYGTYLKNAHLLTFMIDDQIIEEKVMEYGAEITAPEAPEKEGYTFEGWSDLSATMPAKDLVVSGGYTVNSYKLTLYLNDEVYFEETLEYGAEITVPEVDVPDNMKFEGWEEKIPAVMPAHDVTIYGKMVEDGSTAVGSIFNGTDTVTIYNLNGVMLYKDVKVNEIKERLTPGVYVINGKKVIIR